MPDGIAAAMLIVRILLAYGHHLAATLEQRAGARSFSLIAQCFGTRHLAFIRTRISRGILRAVALQRVLLALAEQGRDLVQVQRPHRPSDRPSHRPSPLPPAGHDRNRNQPARQPEELPGNPTLAQLEADIRRRPIGAALADLCRDLGVAPFLCELGFWDALCRLIDWTGGDACNYNGDVFQRQLAFTREMADERTFTLDWPEQTPDGIRRILGFFIGEIPVSPFPPPGTLAKATTGPP